MPRQTRLRTGRSTAFWLAATCALFTDAARAEGIALNRFDPSERGGRWFAADSLSVASDRPWAIGAVLDVAHEPLVALDENGRKVAVPVKDQFFTHLGASVTLAERVRVALNLPLLIASRTSAFESGSTALTPSDGAALGDLRLAGDVRLLGGYDQPFSLASGLALYLPTGSPDALTSDGAVRLKPRAQAAGRVGAFVYAAQVNVHLGAGRSDFGGEPRGTEFGLIGAVGLTAMGGRFTFGPELAVASVLTDGAFLSRSATPFEAILGAHWELARALRLGFGLGPGLSQGLGAPGLRFLWSLEFAPRLEAAQPHSDRDRDGITDADDVCPFVFGAPSEDLARYGCPTPTPPDADNDGINDIDDACPERAGPPTPDRPSTFGCPLPLDSDKDGFVDAADACPEQAGKEALDPRQNGCPPPGDSDGDGVFDDRDACVDKRGMTNPDPAWHGCPRAVIAGTRLNLLGAVQFERNRAKLLKESEEVLLAVARLMVDHPEITLLSIEAHTPVLSGQRKDMELSRKRAEVVMKWLSETGVEAKRLRSTGYGAERPLESDGSEAAREKNSRVEFRILELLGRRLSSEREGHGAP
jgi:outer membrane protein OmpA-like peptidoglycan-associated protein